MGAEGWGGGVGCGGGAGRGGGAGCAFRVDCAGAGGCCGAAPYGICCRICVAAVFGLAGVAIRGVGLSPLLGGLLRLHGFCFGCHGQRRAGHGRARDRAEQVVKGRFIAEPLGEQPIGSEGSSRTALRAYFVGLYFAGTPVNISELSGECWGGGGVLAFCFPHLAAMRHALGCLCVLRKLQRESVLFLREARHGRLPGKACELATQIQLCVAIFFDFASWVLGIGPQAALDRVRPDDSIFLLVSVLGRFD